VRRLATALLTLSATAAPFNAFAAAPASEVLLGEDAPSFSLKTLNPAESGQSTLSLHRYVGEGAEQPRKALVLSFSASYCEPCKKEMAELKKLETRLQKAGVLLAFVVIDTDQSAIEKMRKFAVEELGLSYPILSDRFNIVAKRYRAESLPHLVLIDKGGKVQWVHTGYDPGSIQEILKRTGA
jgi:alkyl hydroperoxide reductase subunit AhpC